MKTGYSILLTFLLVCVISVQGWGKGYRGKDRKEESFLDEPLDFCVGAAGKCLASGQCCEGYVCAAFNDYDGSSPDIPGYCVKEKELVPCTDHSQCPGHLMCSVLEGTNLRYCMQKQHPKRKGFYKLLTTKGGLGSACGDNSDCKPTAADGSPLCCQVVRGFRQRKRTQCDRVMSITKCIKSANEI